MKPIALALLVITMSASAQQASITVMAGQDLGPVNHLIFGHNIEAADNARIFSDDQADMIQLQTGNGFWDPVLKRPVPAIVNACKQVGMSMLRYPGGCLAHNYDWRKAVGPDAKKNGWLFGLDEYLALCQAIGAEPMITVSDYVLPADEMPENASSLVEYLNAPADERHPWALKRAQWGHPEPYHVHWFELGNESIHGNHRVLPRRKYSPEEYAAYSNATAAAMRKVDPSIAIGIVMAPSAGMDIESRWNRTVVHLAGKSADFIVVHLYAPYINKSSIASEKKLMQATMAVGEQGEYHLREYREMVRRESGRDLPLAVTEYNGELGETVKPYRFSYGVALESADMMRIFLDPRNRVATANYWQFLNAYFGMLRSPEVGGKGEPQSAKPAFPLYRLWGQHFGAQLIPVKVSSPHETFEGESSVLPAHGDQLTPRRQIGVLQVRTLLSQQGKPIGTANSFALHVDPIEKESYPLLAHLPLTPADKATEYELTFEARFVPDVSTSLSRDSSIGLGLIDARGWGKTHSAVGVDDITTTWRSLSGVYSPKTDTTQIDLNARIIPNGNVVSGTIEVRNLEIKTFSPLVFPAYATLTSTASLSADKKTMYLLVFNKDTKSLTAPLFIEGFDARQARYWEVASPDLAVFDGVGETVSGAALQRTPEGWSHAFPPYSMTAIEFER